MKTVLSGFKSLAWLPVAGFVGFLGLNAHAATFTVSPSVVSNTYSGLVTLQIGGLTNTEQVTIQHFMDVNTNGTADAGEFLIDTFNLTDGGVSVIGGVTNINVPYDSNATTGAITAALNSSPFVEGLVGQHIYRLISPTGRFSPTNVLFTVTNSAYNQSITGTVFKASVPVSNSVVVALSLPNGNFAAAAAADSGGHYRLKLPTGSYVLYAITTNSYFGVNNTPFVVLTNGATVNTNLFITNATVTISGRIFDSATSNGLGGVLLQLQYNNLDCFTFTDTNGNYSAGVTANPWQVRLNGDWLARRAYDVTGGTVADASGGSVANFNFPLPKANALFYGRLLDDSSAPISGARIRASDLSGLFEGDAYSDPSGNFAVAVYATNNQQACYLDDKSAGLFNYVFAGFTNLVMTNNQAVLVTFSAKRATGRIAGRIQDYLGHGLGFATLGVRINATATIGPTLFNTATVESDPFGNYSLGAVNGTWTVVAECCGNHGLDFYGLYDPFCSHSVAVPPTNAALNIIGYPIPTPALAQPTRLSATDVGFYLGGYFGYNYTIVATTNLSLPMSNWFKVLVVSNLSQCSPFLEDTHATNSQRFYRALIGP